MRIAIFGAGAIGGFFGGLLSESNEVLLVGRRPHVEAIQAQGLKISGLTEKVLRPRASTTLKGFDPEIVILTVKAFDTEKAAQEISAHIGDGCHIMSLQNGLDNLEKLTPIANGRLLVGLTSLGVTFMDFGHIKHAGTGDTVVGDVLGGSPDVAAEVARMFTEAGVPTRVSVDVRKDLWTKAAVNAAINPPTAITGLKNGSLLFQEGLTRLLEDAAAETACVALTRGVELDPKEAIEKAREVATLTADNRSSMLQDVERCKRTEIESICGAIVRYGRLAGIETPVNRTLLALVKALESTYLDG